MVAGLLLFTLLPAYALGGISINLKVSTVVANASADVAGYSVDIISDEERETFNINEVQLLEAVKQHHNGNPDGAYVKSPSCCGDLYKKYKWPQVTRLLKPTQARVIGINAVPTVLLEQECNNKQSSVPIVCKAEIYQEVQETTTNTWSKSGQLSIGQTITYKVGFGPAELGGSTNFTYTSGWGEEHTFTRTVLVGTKSGLDITLPPGKAVIARLTATRGTMDVEVDYAADLDGVVTANYAKPHEGHYFWSYDISNMMEKVGIEPKVVTSREVVKVGFFSNAKVEVIDVATNVVIKTTPASITYINSNNTLLIGVGAD